MEFDYAMFYSTAVVALKPTHINYVDICGMNAAKFTQPNFVNEPEKIVGAMREKNEVIFVIKWKNVEETDLVPKHIALKKWPQLVIQYFEDRLIFKKVHEE